MVDTILLDNLSAVAKQLNSESDTLNNSIAQINEKLRAMNIGLEFYDEIRRTVPERAPKAEFYDIDYLGYAKLDDVWQLAVKSEMRERKLDGDSEDTKECFHGFGETPLLKASRELRLLAAEHLDRFLEHLTHHVQRKLDAVNSAKTKAGLK